MPVYRETAVFGKKAEADATELGNAKRELFGRAERFK
jgi:hypothetical protein